MKRDYFLTLFSSILVIGINLLSFKLVALYFGERGFALFNIGRRAVSVLMPVVLMGLAISLTRLIASHNANDSCSKEQILFNAFLPIATVSFFLVAIAYFYPALSAKILFGNNTLGFLTLPVVIYVAGLALAAVLQSFFRGEAQYLRSNLIIIFCSAFVPLLAIMVAGSRVEHIFLIAGIILFIMPPAA